MFLLTVLEVFVHFLNKWQEANEFLEQPTVLSSVVDEICNKQYLLETSEVDKINRLKSPHHCLL